MKKFKQGLVTLQNGDEHSPKIWNHKCTEIIRMVRIRNHKCTEIIISGLLCLGEKASMLNWTWMRLGKKGIMKNLGRKGGRTLKNGGWLWTLCEGVWPFPSQLGALKLEEKLSQFEADTCGLWIRWRILVKKDLWVEFRDGKKDTYMKSF